MVPPYSGCGWHTSAASVGGRSSGSSSCASSVPTGPSIRWDSMRRATRLVGPVIGELHVDTEIAAAEQRDRLLERVSIASAHAHHIGLNGRLHLQLAVLDFLDDLAGFLDWNPLLQGDLLFHRGPGCGDDRTIDQALQRHLSLDQLLLEDFINRLELELVFAGEQNLVVLF